MIRFKLLISLVTILCVCALSVTSFAKAKPKSKCAVNGDYSFFFWDPDHDGLAGLGFFTIEMQAGTHCRSGAVLAGGVINCNVPGGGEFEDFIKDGSVSFQPNGMGTMEIDTIASAGFCNTGATSLELDLWSVLGEKALLLNSNGSMFVGSGTTPNAGYDLSFTGRADSCFGDQITGCYNVHFWTPAQAAVGGCNICVDGRGNVTGGNCSCNLNPHDGSEPVSQILHGGYTLGENCNSSVGYLWFETVGDNICGISNFLALDFAIAQKGKEIMGACDTAEFVLNNPSDPNTGFSLGCAFEGWLSP